MFAFHTSGTPHSGEGGEHKETHLPTACRKSSSTSLGLSPPPTSPDSPLSSFARGLKRLPGRGATSFSSRAPSSRVSPRCPLLGHLRPSKRCSQAPTATPRAAAWDPAATEVTSRYPPLPLPASPLPPPPPPPSSPPPPPPARNAISKPSSRRTSHPPPPPPHPPPGWGVMRKVPPEVPAWRPDSAYKLTLDRPRRRPPVVRDGGAPRADPGADPGADLGAGAGAGAGVVGDAVGPPSRVGPEPSTGPAAAAAGVVVELDDRRRRRRRAARTRAVVEGTISMNRFALPATRRNRQVPRSWSQLTTSPALQRKGTMAARRAFTSGGGELRRNAQPACSVMQVKRERESEHTSAAHECTGKSRWAPLSECSSLRRRRLHQLRFFAEAFHKRHRHAHQSLDAPLVDGGGCGGLGQTQGQRFCCFVEHAVHLEDVLEVQLQPPAQARAHLCRNNGRITRAQFQ